VSTDQQADSGISLDEQQRKIERRPEHPVHLRGDHDVAPASASTGKAVTGAAA